jgi:hypothetical protein
VTFTLTGSDPVEGSALTFFVVTPPSYGTLVATGANTSTSAEMTYTPKANFFGTDSFTFLVNDGTDNSAPVEVSITIKPVPDQTSGSSSGSGSGGKRVVTIYHNNNSSSNNNNQ